MGKTIMEWRLTLKCQRYLELSLVWLQSKVGRSIAHRGSEQSSGQNRDADIPGVSKRYRRSSSIMAKNSCKERTIKVIHLKRR